VRSFKNISYLENVTVHV